MHDGLKGTTTRSSSYLGSMTISKASKIALVLLSFYLLVSFAAGKLLCDATLHPARKHLTSDDRNFAQSMAARQDAKLEDVSLKAFDGMTLRAWLVIPASTNGSAVILLHGLSDNRTGMIGYAELLLKHGYTVLMPDARAHGESEGSLATYGLLERNDIRNWFGWLQKTIRPTCIDGFGESMGAAQVLQAAETELDFCAIAAESSFSSFREIAYDRVGQFFHTGPWLGRSLLHPTIDAAFWWGRREYHLDLQEVSPQNAVAHSKVPILLIHGTADDNIPFRHAGLIAAQYEHVLVWAVAGANHCGAVSVAADFEPRLVRWLSAHGKNAWYAAARD